MVIKKTIKTMYKNYNWKKDLDSIFSTFQEKSSQFSEKSRLKKLR